MAASYQPTAGPSRSYENIPFTPPVSSKSPTPSHVYSPHAEAPEASWQNGNESYGGSRPDSGERATEGTKRNPLVDLIDTEKTYVDQLGLVIRVSIFTLQQSQFLGPRRLVDSSPGS